MSDMQVQPRSRSTPSFQVFLRGNRSRLKSLYPFLSPQQIMSKLREQWRQLCLSSHRTFSKLDIDLVSKQSKEGIKKKSATSEHRSSVRKGKMKITRQQNIGRKRGNKSKLDPYRFSDHLYNVREKEVEFRNRSSKSCADSSLLRNEDKIECQGLDCGLPWKVCSLTSQINERTNSASFKTVWPKTDFSSSENRTSYPPRFKFKKEESTTGQHPVPEICHRDEPSFGILKTPCHKEKHFLPRITFCAERSKRDTGQCTPISSIESSAVEESDTHDSSTPNKVVATNEMKSHNIDQLEMEKHNGKNCFPLSSKWSRKALPLEDSCYSRNTEASQSEVISLSQHNSQVMSSGPPGHIPDTLVEREKGNTIRFNCADVQSFGADGFVEDSGGDSFGEEDNEDDAVLIYRPDYTSDVSNEEKHNSYKPFDTAANEVNYKSSPRTEHVPCLENFCGIFEVSCNAPLPDGKGLSSPGTENYYYCNSNDEAANKLSALKYDFSSSSSISNDNNMSDYSSAGEARNDSMYTEYYTVPVIKGNKENVRHLEEELQDRHIRFDAPTRDKMKEPSESAGTSSDNELCFNTGNRNCHSLDIKHRLRSYKTNGQFDCELVKNVETGFKRGQNHDDIKAGTCISNDEDDPCICAFNTKATNTRVVEALLQLKAMSPPSKMLQSCLTLSTKSMQTIEESTKLSCEELAASPDPSDWLHCLEVEEDNGEHSQKADCVQSSGNRTGDVSLLSISPNYKRHPTITPQSSQNMNHKDDFLGGIFQDILPQEHLDTFTPGRRLIQSAASKNSDNFTSLFEDHGDIFL